MKKRIQTIIGLLALSILFNINLSEAGTRVYVRVAPPKAKIVKVVRPAKPFRSAVWVAAHYQYRNGQYVWVKGHWVKSRHGYVYIQPIWKKHKRGYYYVPGHWVKK